jgi:BASS family bile acid:Na+ symporter
MFEQIMLLLGIPIVAGIAFAHYFPNATKRLLKLSQILSIILFMGMVVVSFTKVVSSLQGHKDVVCDFCNTTIVEGASYESVILAVVYAFVVVIVHNICALSTGFGGGTLFRLPKLDRRSLTIEVGIQNSGLGLILLFNDKIFDPAIWDNNGGMVFITAIWGVWHIISGLITSSIFRRTKLV